MQKVMIKGLARDDKTLRQLGVVSGAKVMVIGSTLNDVLSVAKPDTKVSTVHPGTGDVCFPSVHCELGCSIQ